MPIAVWFRPPRHLLPLFLLVTLAPSTLLVYSGWHQLEQEQTFQRQTARDKREAAADLAVGRLLQRLEGVARELREPASLPAANDTATVVFTAASIQGRLLYYPRTEAGREAPPDRFARGEALESRARDYAQAAATFAELARSRDPAIRAGALLRQARTLRKDGHIDSALTALSLAGQPRAAIAGVPADLFARWYECDSLAAATRTGELQRKAAALYADLLAGRWRLDGATFDVYVTDAGAWMDGAAPPVPPDQLALAAAAERLWNRWKEGDATGSKNESLEFGGRRVTVVWAGTPVRLTAWIAGPDYIERTWLAALPHVKLSDPSTPSLNGEVRRSANDYGLPWTVTIAESADDLDTSRRNLWIAVLALLLPLVIAGTYLIARAVSRELAVARLQSDFVAAVSHEFRTPLTSLRQFTEVLRDGRVVAEDRRHSYYDAMARQTQRLHDLVENLLDFGRMESGASPYRLESINACDWVRSVINQFSQEHANRCQVVLDLDGASVAIAADRSALTNALWNLLDNAVKYSPDCRTVWVTADRNGGRLAVRVRDCGLGIPLDEQKRIFQKFVRGAGARTASIKGTGIGLAMVDHIVKAHGGEVHVESEPGFGSTFTMFLPCRES